MAIPGSSLPASGPLSSHSFLQLYYLAASQDQTGLLTLQLQDRAIEVHFRKGNPEYVGSSHPEDSVGGFLIKSGLATREQVQQAEAARDRFGGELIGALFGLGILNPGTAFAQLAQRASSLLLKAVLGEAGTFTFEPKELPAHRAMPLGNRWAVVSDLVRRVPLAELKRRLTSAVDLPIMKSGGRISATELRLTPQETRALTYIDGVRSLSQLWSDLPQETEALARLAFMLRELELVSFASTPVPPRKAESPRPAPAAGSTAEAAKPPPASPPPQAARPAPPPTTGPRPAAPTTGPRPAASAAPPAPVLRPAAPTATPAAASGDTGAELAELRKLAARLKEQNHFEVLGLKENADGAAIKIAYFKLAKVHHPDTVPPGAPPEMGQLKGEIFAAVGEAYRTLSDDKSRAEYIEQLKSGGQGDLDVAQILMAEESFQKGTIMVKARKFAEAVKLLDEAIKANPEEGEFYAWRGFATFHAIEDKKQAAAAAQKDLQLCLKKNEMCAPAYYFLGVIAKATGDEKTALKHFKKTVELNPQHIDAMREVRMMSSKK